MNWRMSHALAPVCLSLMACSPSSAEPHRDVIFVVLDTVRADAIGPDATRPTSPQFNAIAEAGAWFTDATISSSWTWPAHATLFTGRPPWEHGAHFAASGELSSIRNGFPALRKDLPTLAEVMGAAGYETVSLSANCLLAEELGLTRGFSQAQCLDKPGEVEREAASIIQKDRQGPLFLFINLMPAHAPYSLTQTRWARPHAPQLEPETAPDWVVPYLVKNPPGVDLQLRQTPQSLTGVQKLLSGQLSIPEEGWTMLRDLYDGEVLEADLRLNRIMSLWTQQFPTGIVAVTSDHGEALGEQNRVDHRGSVYAPITHVPLALAAPGIIQAGTKINAPIQMDDLPATILALSGLPDSALGGTSMLDTMDETSTRPKSRIIRAVAWPDPYRATALGGEFADVVQLIRDGELALISSSSGVHQVFDLESDPLMLTDIADQQAAWMEDHLALLLSPTVLQAEDSMSAGESTPSAEVTERLRALGYIQ